MGQLSFGPAPLRRIAVRTCRPARARGQEPHSRSTPRRRLGSSGAQRTSRPTVIRAYGLGREIHASTLPEHLPAVAERAPAPPERAGSCRAGGFVPTGRVPPTYARLRLRSRPCGDARSTHGWPSRLPPQMHYGSPEQLPPRWRTTAHRWLSAAAEEGMLLERVRTRSVCMSFGSIGAGSSTVVCRSLSISTTPSVSSEG
jgi:hypothetical protein